jgi:hypothetical protein
MLSYSIVKAGGMFLLLASGMASGAHGSSYSMRKLKGDVCRGEEVCLNQVCDPASYQYSIGNEGDEFPYTVTHKSSRDGIEFEVCPSKDAKSACESKSGGCAPLRSVKLRMRNDMLSLGRDLVTEPQGTMWASCQSNGPGHVWNFEDLGTLSSQPPSTSSCTTLKVIGSSNGGKTAQLKDICQQDIKIVENTGWTVFDQKARPNSCIVVLETANGRVGYTAVGGSKAKPEEEEEKATVSSKDEKEEEKATVSSKDEKEEEKATVSDAEDKKEDKDAPTTSDKVETSSDSSEEAATVSSASSPTMYGQRISAMNVYGQRASSMNAYGQRSAALHMDSAEED